MLKKFLFSAVSFAALALAVHAAEPIFELNFDAFNTMAALANGESRCLNLADIDLKSRAFPGVGGKGNAVVFTSGEYCTYSAEGNFNPAEGTVSLWVAPQNWRPSEKQYQVFFEVRLASGMVLTVYKYVYANCFYANMTNPGIPGANKALCASTLMTDDKWPQGKWHKMDATWNATELKLYIDGVQQPNVTWHRSTKKFPAGTTFPAVAKGDTFTIGAGPYWSKRQVADHKTAYDQIQIYDRALNAEEIKKNFEQGVVVRAETAKKKITETPVQAAPASKVSSTTPAGKDVSFEVNFDSFSTHANFARGNAKCLSMNNPDLQMRMFKGVNDQGNAIVLDGTECCTYEAEKNFNSAAGTVTLWVAPQNWQPSEKIPQVFFEAQLAGGMTLIVYKYFFANCFYAYLSSPGIAGPQKNMCASSLMADTLWPQGKWHRLDVTWDTESIKLYVDGLQQPDVTWHRHTRAFPKGTKFPAVAKGDTITVGAGANWRRHVNPKHRTAFDIVRIHDRVLSAEEIRKDYERVVPSSFGKKQEANLLTIPFVEKSPKLDGVIGEDWQEATAVPMDLVMLSSESRLRQGNIEAYLAYDKEFLYIGAHLDRPMKPGKIKDADGNLWEDDSLEFHFSKKGINDYQFIVNAEGVIYDARNQNKAWNAQAKTVARNDASGWTLEMAIPRSAFGKDFTPGDIVEGGLFMAFQTRKGLAAHAWNDSGNKMFFNNYANFRIGKAGEGVQMSVDAPREQGNFSVTLKAAKPEKMLVKTLLTAENVEPP